MKHTLSLVAVGLTLFISTQAFASRLFICEAVDKSVRIERISETQFLLSYQEKLAAGNVSALLNVGERLRLETKDSIIYATDESKEEDIHEDILFHEHNIRAVTLNAEFRFAILIDKNRIEQDQLYSSVSGVIGNELNEDKDTLTNVRMNCVVK